MSAYLSRFGTFTFLSLMLLHAAGQTSPLKTSPENPDKTAIRLLRLPLAFEPNVGQAGSGSDYLVRTSVIQAELSATGVRLSLPPASGQQKQVSIHLDGARKERSRRQLRGWKASRTIWLAMMPQTGTPICRGLGE